MSPAFYSIAMLKAKAREPLTKFHRWPQKRTKEHNIAVKQATDKGEVPL